VSGKLTQSKSRSSPDLSVIFQMQNTLCKVPFKPSASRATLDGYSTSL
jgi:hypothetical protein